MTGSAFAAFAALLHGATSWRYGYFRDELYFIACAKHLAWGYVDQPPLVAFAAWLSAPFGYHLVALRALPVIAAALTVYFAIALTRELGGGRFACILAGTATLLAPAYLLLGNVLTTTSFEPLSWTLTIYACVRIVRRSKEASWRDWLLLGLAVAFAAYGKYSIGLLVLGLLVGVVLTPARRMLLSPWPFAAAAFALILLAPNLAWQGAHGWPMLEVLHGDAAHRPAFQSGLALESVNLWNNTVAFALEQLVYLNPLAAPVWLAGLIAPFRIAGLRELRFVAIAYAVTFVVAAALAAKGYYIAGIYASLFAIGAVALERAVGWLRIAVLVAVGVVGVVTMPLSLPALPVDAFIAYSKALGLTGRDGAAPHLMQPVYAEEFGWDRLAHDVFAVYASLPPDVRSRTAVYADTYADAGALDFYGPHYGLPPAISSQNSYYLWGTGGYDGSTLIAVGATKIDVLKKYYRSVTLAATSLEPYKWVVEGASPIYLCRDPIEPLDQIWPNLRWYGA